MADKDALLSLRDAMEDWHVGEYTLKTRVVIKIGLHVRTWELVIDPPNVTDKEGHRISLISLRRWQDDDHEHEDGDEIVTLTEWYPDPDLEVLAVVYGIKFDQHLFELEWLVPAGEATIARASDPRWPNTNTDEGE